MEIVILERRRKSASEVRSKIKVDNLILNVTSQFESKSSLDDLLFRISEQKIMKLAKEETAVAHLPCHTTE